MKTKDSGADSAVNACQGHQAFACQVQGVIKTYRVGDRKIRALDGLDASIQSGSFAAFVGPSGSGKTTFLNMIGCIEVPDGGKIEVLGEQTAALSDRTLTRLRRDSIGFIFQHFSLIPVLSAAENVEYPLILSKESAANRRARVRRILDRVGLLERAGHLPGELSGGQRQRVAIARALIKNPKLVIADEPTANLDSKTGDDLLNMMRAIQEEQGTTFVIATHDPGVQAHADRVFHVLDGKIVQERAQ